MPNASGIKTACWRQDGSQARLELNGLQATVDPSRPVVGLSKLIWQGRDTAGNLLGVSAGEETATTSEESFLRGNDAIVLCASSKPQRFQWQVYWRASSLPNEVKQIDLIVSLQTSLLESFPGFTTYSVLPTGERWDLSRMSSPEHLSLDEASAEPQLGLDCIALRHASMPWTYVEMLHPADQAETTFGAGAQNETKLQRIFGGKFLEKGVIRRMRLRGVILPREGDLEAAARLFAEFCEEQPPLTA